MENYTLDAKHHLEQAENYRDQKATGNERAAIEVEIAKCYALLAIVERFDRINRVGLPVEIHS